MSTELSMTVDMDGLRTSLTESVIDLKEFVGNDFNNFDETDLFEAVNSVIRWSNALNMVFSDEIKGFSDLTDKNFIEFLDY